MNGWTLLSTYAALAVLATGANIGAQMLCIAAYDGAGAVPLSMAAGTGVGLLLKYGLDKRYIFACRPEGLAHDGRLFALYSLTGLFTTALFWGVELLFHWLFASDAWRYAGGVLGLALGYALKYRLDRRFVFVRSAAG